MSTSTESRALAAVILHEHAAGRTAERAPYGSGYDLDSAGPDGTVRHIEVKSTRNAALTMRWLEPKEFERFETDPDFYLYAVVSCYSAPRVIEFDRDALLGRYVGPTIKHVFRFPDADFSVEQPDGCAPGCTRTSQHRSVQQTASVM